MEHMCEHINRYHNILEEKEIESETEGLSFDIKFNMRHVYRSKTRRKSLEFSGSFILLSLNNAFNPVKRKMK